MRHNYNHSASQGENCQNQKFKEHAAKILPKFKGKKDFTRVKYTAYYHEVCTKKQYPKGLWEKDV